EDCMTVYYSTAKVIILEFCLAVLAAMTFLIDFSNSRDWTIIYSKPVFTWLRYAAATGIAVLFLFYLFILARALKGVPALEICGEKLRLFMIRGGRVWEVSEDEVRNFQVSRLGINIKLKKSGMFLMTAIYASSGEAKDEIIRFAARSSQEST
ncbi:MAG TPA: hypothetical protein VIC34_10370, partial [Croceibacterium sp.]